MNFINGLKNQSNFKLTENGQPALKSTLNNLVDLFGTIGALRNRNEQDIISNFIKAFAQDKLLALKILFYSRNIRGLGQGERRTFRIITRYLAEVHTDIMRKNLHLIPTFGRWDDLYTFIATPLEKDAFDLMYKQLIQDISNMKENKPISLLAKWLKQESSGKIGKTYANFAIKYFNFTKTQYRKILSQLKAYLKITERSMSTQKWNEIEYPSVPSLAMKRYRKAFPKHDKQRFNEYLASLKKGTAKINASTLYPYDIIRLVKTSYNEILEAQWKALPNYIENEHNILIMADTSGSMSWSEKSNVLPIDIAISLAIYFAERNSGPYQNKFLTFSETPELVEIKGEKLYDKIHSFKPIIANTNLEAAFNLILDIAIQNNLKNEDLPKSIIVISDMEFDKCVIDNNTDYKHITTWTFYDEMKERFTKAGYEIPNIIFWTVNTRTNTFHTTSKYQGVQIASGASPSILKAILNQTEIKTKTPVELMMDVLNNEIFKDITI